MPELNEWLAQLSAAELDALLVTRPDARRFRTQGRQLGYWLAQPSSVSLAVYRLDRFGLQLLDVCRAVAAGGRLSRSQLDVAVGDAATSSQLDQGLAGLQRLALVWPDGKGLGLTDLSYVLPPRPLGLGSPLRTALTRVDASSVRSMVASLGLGPVATKTAALGALERHHRDPEAVRAVLSSAPADVRELIERLDAGRGMLRDPGSGYHGRRRAGAMSNVEWLVQRALLVSTDWSTLEIPREVTVGLRGGRLVRRLDPDRPVAPGTAPAAAGDVDRVAASAATGVLDAATALAELIDEAPLARLKNGGIGRRELRRLGARLDRDEADVTELLNLLGAAGLLDADERVSLDAAYDGWLGAPAARRFRALVDAWLRMGQPLSLTDDDKLYPALLPVTLRPPVRLPALKRALLAAHDGATPDLDVLVQQSAWDQPLLLENIADQLVPGLVGEAALLGLVAQGTLSDAGRALLLARPPSDLNATTWFPPAIDDLLLQADLTAVVPGPPSAQLRALLDAAADRESRGGASTWRFGAASVRRALDAGFSATELLDRLAASARHGVPQPLDYLVRDVERQHGRLRISPARCVLRCADEALAGEVLRTRSLSRLRLREVAPAVLVGSVEPDAALIALQAAGFAPVVEDGSGQAVLQRIGGGRGSSGKQLANMLSDAGS